LILSLANTSKTSYYISMTNFNIEKNQAQINYGLIHPGTFIRKIISIFLGAQSLYAIYGSTKFILFDRAEIETAISQHQLNESSMNFYMSKIVLTIFSILSLWFAVHLFGPKKSISKNLQMLIGVLLIIANTYLMNAFSQLPIFEQILPLIDFS